MVISHLGKFNNTSSFQHFLKGDALGEVFKSESSTAHLSPRKSEKDTSSSTVSPEASPDPSPEGLKPLASTLSPVEICSSVSMESHSSQSVSQPPELLIALGEHLSCSTAHFSHHSHVPQSVVCPPSRPNSNQGLPLYNIKEVPPENTPQSCSPTNGSRVPSPIPAFNSDILELLEVVINKRAKLKTSQDIEHPLDSLGNMMRSLGSEQDTAAPQPFWNTKPEQLPDSQEHIFPAVLGEQLQQKCNQLFWGLPFLHSESLVAPVRVSGHPLDLPSILFNGLSSYIPIPVQANVPPQLFPPQPLLHHLVQSQTLTPNLPWPQPPPGAETHIHFPSCTPPTRNCAVSSPTTEESNKCTIPPVIQQLECHLLKKHKQSQSALPSVVKQSHEVFSNDQEAPDPGHFPGDLISSDFQKKLENHLQERFTQHCYKTQCNLQQCPEEKLSGPAQADKSCQATQKAISECSEEFPGWKKGLCLSRGMKALDRDTESSSEEALDSFTDLTESLLESSSDSEYVCPMHPDKYRRRDPLKIHSSPTWGPINVGASQCRGAPDDSLSSLGNAQSSVDTGRATCNSCSRKVSSLDSATRQLLEEHIKKLWVRHKWGLFLKVLKPINQLALKRAAPVPAPQGAARNLACRDLKGDPTAKGLVPQGAPPKEPRREEAGRAEGAGAGAAGILPSPLLECLRRLLCSYARVPVQAAPPLLPPPRFHEAGLLAQPISCNLVGRSWHRDVVPGCEGSSLDPTSSSQTDPSESPKTDSLLHNVSIREVFVESSLGTAEDVREMAGDDEEEQPTDLAVHTDSSHLNLRSLDVLRATQTPCPSRTSILKPPRDLCLTEQAESSASQSPALGVVLQDCETDAFLQTCSPAVLLAAHVLPSRSSLSSSRNFSGSSTSGYGPCPPLPNGAHPQKQQESEASNPQDPWYSKMFEDSEKKICERPRVRIREEKAEEARSSQRPKRCLPAPARKPRSARRKAFLPEPQKAQPPPESHLGNRVKNFFMSFFPGKGRAQADSLPKFRIQSTGTQTQDLGTSRMFESSKASEAQELMNSVGRNLEKKVGSQQERSPSKKTLHKEFQAPVRRNSHYHVSPSCLRQCPFRNRVCCHQTSCLGHSRPVSDRMVTYQGTASPPRRPVSLASHPCQHRQMGTNISGHQVHCPRHCPHVTGLFCGHAYHPTQVVSCGVYFPQDNFQPMHSNTIVFI
ncbi:spermatogenesis-associated protein 31E1-like [Perognathus longimembris pacificus]|uniref:spermatogenesis-associated protein 31E1-like n=1 Tax=Perognathus longimembris pacificus TaxID=214514 RepID=UPI00201A07AD|nr:spermatogenesis-associated protein 31E1-like [Perognathus longimembris pacificus]